MKRIIASIVVLAMTLMTGCTGSSSKTGTYTPGKYTGTATGHNGDVTVEVEVSSDQIKSVNITSQNETEGIADTALKKIPQEIVDAQSTEVDAVSGSTVTSKAITEAVDQALAKARGETAAASAAEMKEGTYLGTAEGMKGQVKVNVTVDQSSIKAVEIESYEDTEPIFAAAAAALPDEIVAKQTVSVDTVTGATYSSYGILNAVKDALKQAGAADDQFTAKPETADKPEVSEPEQYDAVVVGAGMAGMSAALEIAQNSDYHVLLLEKLAYPGGSAIVCGGGLWSAAGADDSDEAFEKYKSTITSVSSTTDYYNFDLMKKIYDTSYDTFTKLKSSGLAVDDSLTKEYPDQGFVEYTASSGEEGAYYLSNKAGAALTESVVKMISSSNVELRCNSKVESLVISDGNVTGVKVEGPDSIYTVNAKQIILATGGFSRNSEMISKYDPDYADCQSFSGAGAEGDGYALLEPLGTQVIGSGVAQVPGVSAAIGPYGNLGNVSWTAQLYVNKSGQEYGITTDTYFQDKVLTTAAQEGKQGYCICDSTYQHLDAFEDHLDNSIVKKADTVEELAEAEGIDADGLKKTMEAKGLTKAPFYCVPIVGLQFTTLSGIKVNSDLQPVQSDGTAVKNVYAIGELVFGNVMYDEDPIPGNCVANALYMGRLAGDSVIADLNSSK